MEDKKRNQILLVLFIGVLMGALDIAIVGPALPAIQKTFGVGERTLAWMFSIYVLFNLIGTPLMAKLSDLFGRRMVYVLDVSLFAAGSLLVALSPSFSVVLVGRAIQGFGAGGIFPVASAVIGDTFPARKARPRPGPDRGGLWPGVYHRPYPGGCAAPGRLAVAVYHQFAHRSRGGVDEPAPAAFQAGAGASRHIL